MSRHALPLLLALLLALALPTPARPVQDDPLGHPDLARIAVHRGRAVVHAPQRAQRTVRRGQDVTVTGAAHLEVGAGSEVEVLWPGRASLRLWGPAALQWEPLPPEEDPEEDVQAREPPEDDPLQTFPRDGLRWQLFDLAWADVEVRRGSHVLRLPGDWRLDCSAGAFHLRGLPGGPAELRHHAGAPVVLTWLGDPSRARPPIVVYSGSSLRMDRPLPPPPTGSEEVRGWAEPDWPWRDPADTPDQRRERRELARQTTLPPGTRSTDPREWAARSSVGPGFEPRDLRIEVHPAPTDRGRRPVRRSTDPLGLGPAAQRSRSAGSGGGSTGRAGGEPPGREWTPRPAPQRGDSWARRPAIPRELSPREPSPREPSPPQPSPPQRHTPGPVQGEPVQPQADSPEPAPRIVPQPPSPRVGPRVSPRVAPQPSAGSSAFRPEHWRGLDPGDLNGAGAVAVQRTPDVEVRVFSSGRHKVFLDALAPAPVWCFGPHTDYRLHPGAVIVFEPDGTPSMRFGTVQEHPPVEGRPPYADLR